MSGTLIQVNLTKNTVIKLVSETLITLGGVTAIQVTTIPILHTQFIIHLQFTHHGVRHTYTTWPQIHDVASAQQCTVVNTLIGEMSAQFSEYPSITRSSGAQCHYYDRTTRVVAQQYLLYCTRTVQCHSFVCKGFHVYDGRWRKILQYVSRLFIRTEIL